MPSSRWIFMRTVTTECSQLSEMRMCYCSKGMSADFLCPTPPGLPPSCLRQYSRGAVRAVGTGMGFPTAKLSKRTQGFPNFPAADCFQSVFSPSSLGGDWRKTWGGTPQPGDLVYSLSHVERSRIKASHRRGERISPGSPCTGRVPAGTASNPVNICLKVQCGWKSWGRRQKLYGCMKGETSGNSAFA